MGWKRMWWWDVPNSNKHFDRTLLPFIKRFLKVTIVVDNIKGKMGLCVVLGCLQSKVVKFYSIYTLWWLVSNIFFTDGLRVWF